MKYSLATHSLTSRYFVELNKGEEAEAINFFPSQAI
jgi:hypothetical protein